MSYHNQNEGRIGLLEGEVIGKIFTEADRMAAYRDIKNNDLLESDLEQTVRDIDEQSSDKHIARVLVAEARATSSSRRSTASLERLAELQEAGSYQARILRGIVACGVVVDITDQGLVRNFDELIKNVWQTEHAGNEFLAGHIAEVAGLPKGSLTSSETSLSA